MGDLPFTAEFTSQAAPSGEGEGISDSSATGTVRPFGHFGWLGLRVTLPYLVCVVAVLSSWVSTTTVSIIN